MKIKRMPVGMYLANCYILLDEDSNECAVIDPGGNTEIIKSAMDDLKINKVKYILLTHGHADHTESVVDIKNLYGAEVYINEQDYNMMKRRSYMYGNVDEAVDNFINDGDVFNVGKLKVKALYTPGHTPGGVSFLVDDIVFTGDTLFCQSVGRTDIEGGDFDTIIKSIKEKLMVLPEYTIVLPGHGDKTSIEREKISNPFL
ncbi:glyoxylase-like metal-dependent hydrolase (beta-lactamase superfamily II) [Clostridium algifaecis]|uniref:Glyoxylase-like metal-dependent hydrolase (Beta-lactamase superfamily II) n=1 Tax=Clostridium algifaecis TaxID=1472040 RepID=A0ABS4KR56_9CLOT|nr:MBL fold metallo-hydrolase [Clostridium algifaecis]MBP2032509.1 glyoxylase-like metal-dependent hydrolase (beta-lactamase superfamily II) [Clostridium algifaecis]